MNAMQRKRPWLDALKQLVDAGDLAVTPDKKPHESLSAGSAKSAEINTVAAPAIGDPGFTERCRYCGVCMWMYPMAWQCGRCHALWRPSRAAEKAREPGKAS